MVEYSAAEERLGAARALWRKPIFLQCLSCDVDTSRDGLSGLRRLRKNIVAEDAVAVYVHFLLLAAILRHGVFVICPGRTLQDSTSSRRHRSFSGCLRRARVFHAPSGVKTMYSPVVERYPTKTPTFQSESNLASFEGTGTRLKSTLSPNSEVKHVRFLALQAFTRSLAIVAHRVAADQNCSTLDQPAQDLEDPKTSVLILSSVADVIDRMCPRTSLMRRSIMPFDPEDLTCECSRKVSPSRL